MKYYKILDAEGRACNGGNFQYSLPTVDDPGEWAPLIEEIIPCKAGYHICTEDQIVFWLNDSIYEVEIRGEVVTDEDKTVAQQVRLVSKLDWDRKKLLFFVADCAERVLHFYEEKYPDDPRPRQAIEALRAYNRGEISIEDLKLSRNAAYDAANAAYAAARVTAFAAFAAYAAATHAQAAATAAARAADAAERKWQVERLKQYLRGEVH